MTPNALPISLPSTEPANLPIVSAILRSKTHAGLLRRLIEREEPVLHDLLHRPEVISAGHWQETGAIDGFITAPGGSSGSMDLASDELMPRLSEVRLLRSEYSDDTLANYIYE
ncbi:hypothetical protein [Pseudochrobactrum asaccharolyticum]|uniref:hypothetical protein n=1 Tax=Pseudochrobactrum asaccharolyticum TaxID=354351 RepID=UPI001FE11BD2|nr:hypothetical protein [Pseudochrobactrum asaccharolyticum]